MGFRFPSISFHKRLSQLLVEEWGASPADPALLLIFKDYTFKLKVKKKINKKKKKQSRKLNHKNFGC